MHTKRNVILSVFALAVLGVAAATAPPTGTKDGKTIFLENKCNTCHTLQSAGIEKKKAATADPAETKIASTRKPPDLSGVGLERKAEWIERFLTKTESIKGEKHPRKFRGTEPELKVVAAWLATMKVPAKK